MGIGTLEPKPKAAAVVNEALEQRWPGLCPSLSIYLVGFLPARNIFSFPLPAFSLSFSLSLSLHHRLLDSIATMSAKEETKANSDGTIPVNLEEFSRTRDSVSFIFPILPLLLVRVVASTTRL